MRQLIGMAPELTIRSEWDETEMCLELQANHFGGYSTRAKATLHPRNDASKK